MKAEDFYHRQGVRVSEPSRYSYVSVKALPLLAGHPWDDIALAFVIGLRPSMIRVIRDEETMDAQPWRVSVYVDSDNRIESIRQEVVVWLPEGVENGYDLRQKLDANPVLK